MTHSNAGRKTRPSDEEIARLKNQRPPDGLARQNYTWGFQIRLSQSTREQIELLDLKVGTSERNEILRAAISRELSERIQSDASDLAADLIDELQHGVSETPELNELIDLCGEVRSDAIAVVKSAVTFDYQHPIDWEFELAKAYALVAAYRLGANRQADEL